MTISYIEKIEQEIKQMPEEYLPALFDIVQIFRESVNQHSSEIKLMNKTLFKFEEQVNQKDDLNRIENKETLSKKRRQPPESIAGKAKIMGDLTEPCCDIEDFECLK
jgi:hypothetical protein